MSIHTEARGEEATSQPLDVIFTFELPDHGGTRTINDIAVVDLARPDLHIVCERIEERLVINIGRIQTGKKVPVKKKGMARRVVDKTGKWKYEYPLEYVWHAFLVKPDGERVELSDEKVEEIEKAFSVELIEGGGLHILVECALDREKIVHE